MRSARAIAATSSIVAALFLLPLTASAPLAAAGPVRLTIGVIGPIGSLDPATASGAVAREVWQLQYPTLTTFAPSPLDVVPGLADGWTATADGRGFVYTLRPATWTDGQPVTAADVVSSLDRARDGHWPYAAGLVDDLTAIALDPQHGAGHEPRRGQRAAGAPAPRLPGDGVRIGVGNADAPGSGPWHVVDRSDGEVRMAVVDRPGRPPLDEIVFRSYPDAPALEARARERRRRRGGRVRAPRLRTRPGDRRRGPRSTPTTATSGRCNCASATLRFGRQSPKQSTATVWSRRSRTVSAGRRPSRSSRARPSGSFLKAAAGNIASQLTFDPAAARAAVTSHPEPVAVTIAAPSDADGRALTREVTQMLEAVGITVTPIADGACADLTIVRRDPTDDPTDVLAQYTCAGGIWCDATYDAAFAAYTAAPDATGRRDAAHTMVQRIAEQATEVVLFAPDQLQSFTTRNVTGLLQEPSDPRLVVFWPSVQQYGDVHATPAPAAEELPNRTFAALAITGAVVVGLGVVVIDRRIQARR